MTEPETRQSGRRDGLIVRIWRRRVLFATVFAAVMVVAIGALLVLPARYVATGSVIVAEQEPGLTNTSPAWTQKIGDPADLESQLLVISSPRLLHLAMQDPKAFATMQTECRYLASADPLSGLLAEPCDDLKPDSEALIEYLSTRYSVDSVGRSRVIDISYKSPLPEVAQTMANALVNAFLNDQRDSISESRGLATAWLWQELRRVGAELHDDEAKIEAFRSSKGLMRGATAPISSERLTITSNQLAAAKAERAKAAATLEEIRASAAGGAADAPAVLASRTVSDLKQQLTAVSAQLASAELKFGPRHPTLVALRQQRDDIQARMRAEIASLAASAQKAYEAADALVASLSAQQQTVQAEVAAAMADGASIESMVRNAGIKRQQYSELYQRASALETERRVLQGSTRLVSLAELPSKPFFPRRLPFLAAGLTFASLFAAAAALMRDRSDHSVRASSELSVMTGAPILAQLSRLRRSGTLPVLGAFGERDDSVPLRVTLKEAQSDQILQDSLRKLYANVILTGGASIRTLQVTSSGPREGKTFTTLALAQLVAKTGRRVLVVECDMRRPQFAEALGIESGPGLDAVLRGRTLPSGAVVKTAMPNLDVIPAGKPTTDSTELLMNEYMSAVAHYARAYDLALFDSPPASAVMDAHVVAKHVDGVLCCTRWGRSSITAAVATVNEIRAAGGNVLGMTITMVKPDDYALYERSPVLSAAYIGAAG